MDPDEKTCPYCAETIKAAAVKCRHCGEMLGDRPSEVPSPEVVQPVATGTVIVQGAQVTPPANGAEALGQLGLWGGISMFLYGLYTSIGVSDTRHAMGEYGDAGMFNRMSENATFWMVVGGIVGMVSLFLIASSKAPPAEGATATGSPVATTSPPESVLTKSISWENHLSPQQRQMGVVAMGVVLFISFLVVYSAMK